MVHFGAFLSRSVCLPLCVRRLLIFFHHPPPTTITTMKQRHRSVPLICHLRGQAPSPIFEEGYFCSRYAPSSSAAAAAAAASAAPWLGCDRRRGTDIYV